MDDNVVHRVQLARNLWRESGTIYGTLGERYFVEHRKRDIRKLDVAHVLRWHPGRRCIVALMTDPETNEFTGIHRTLLAEDGSKLTRKMLGRVGVIRLCLDSEAEYGLCIAEGIEDALALMLDDIRPVWAATSSGAIARFPVLAGLDHLTIFADSDDAGMNAAMQCAQAWNEQGKETRILPAPRRAP